MRDCNKLSYDELVQINDELRQIISDLKKEKEEYNKCTSTVYDPNRMMDQKTLIEQKVKYAVSEKNREIKKLEEKLAILEQEKKTAIDRLVDSMAQMNKEIQACQQNNYNLKSRNKDLERVIEKQNVVITLAAGYISSCEQFRTQHPIEVKKWLMGGME